MEEAVQEQLRQGRQELETLAADPDVEPKKLAETYGELGQLYLAYDLGRAAEACLHNASVLAPEEFRWHYLLATRYQQERRLDDALASFEEALARRPRDLPALIRLGQVRLAQDELEEATAAFERALEVEPSAAAAWAGQAKAAAARGEPEIAVRHFEKALELEPDASALRYPLAIAYRELGRIDKARVELQRRGDVEAAFEDPLIVKLAELAAGSGIHVMAGNRALRQGHVEAAIDRYRRALAANPRSFEAHQALAAVLVVQGDVEGAVEHYSAALEAEPDNPRVLYNLGTLRAQQGQLETAIRHFQTALELAPEYVDARFNLGAALAGTGRGQEALGHYQRLVELSPDDPEIRLQAGNLSARLGHFDEAVEHFGAVILRSPQNLGARFGQTMALLLAERYDEARRRLEEGLMALPDGAELAHLLARFLATCPDDRLRDGERALEIAQSLLRSSGRPDVAETVAMALAEVGRFDEAIALQRQLIQEAERAGANAVLDPLRRRLVLYEGGKPCRAPWLG